MENIGLLQKVLWKVLWKIIKKSNLFYFIFIKKILSSFAYFLVLDVENNVMLKYKNVFLYFTFKIFDK